MPPKSCVLKRALRETLRFFPLSRKVVDFPIIPSLSGREECGVYWKELDVLYHRSDESDDDEGFGSLGGSLRSLVLVVPSAAPSGAFCLCFTTL